MPRMTAAALSQLRTIAGETAKSGPPRSPPPRQNTGDRLFFILLRSSAFVPLLLILVFLSVLSWGAWPAIKTFGWSFLWSTNWDPTEGREEYGALAFILGTLFSSLFALAIAAPVGIGVATFLNEVFPPRLRGVMAFLIEILATIPSIVYGVWAFFVMVPWVESTVIPVAHWIFGPRFFLFRGTNGFSLFSGGLVLAVMILPVIVSISLDSIRAVPSTYREAALGLGATRFEMIRLAVWPSARSGMLGACILALGRAMGETMAITMVIGNAQSIQWSLFGPANSIASAIALQFGEATGLMQAALIELALVLFVMTLLLNLAARALVRNLSAQKGVRA